MTAADDKIRIICETAYETFKDLVKDFHRFYIALYDKTHPKMRFPFVIENDNPSDYITRPFDRRYLPDYAISTKEIIKLNRDQLLEESNNNKFTYWPENDFLPVSVVCIPLLAGESVLGVLVVEKRAGTSAISNSDFIYIDEIAQQVAVAIDRYFIHESLEGKVKKRTEQLEKKTKALEAVHDIGVKLTEGIQLGEKKILEIIKKYAEWVMDTQNMYIALYDPDPNDQPEDNLLYGVIRYGLMYVDGKPEEMPEREAVPGEFGRTEVILATQKPILNRTREESKMWHELPGHKNFLSAQFGDFASWLGVPMIASGKSIGVIATYHKSKEYLYNEDHKQVLTMMASQAATAIENSRLYQRLEKRIKAVHDIGVKLTESITLGEEKILQLIKEHADRLMDTDNMYIALYEPDPTMPDIFYRDQPEKCLVHGLVRFGLMYVDGKPKNMADRKSKPGKYGRTEVILATRKPILNKTRRESEEWYSIPGHENFLDSEETKKQESFAAWLGVPMIAAGKPIGVIATYHKIEEYLYDEDNQQDLMMMASHAAIAIENSKLYQDIKIKSEEIEKTVNDKINYERLLTFNKMGMELAHHMNNIAGTLPVRAKMALKLLDSLLDPYDLSQSNIAELLEWIYRDSKRFLDFSNSINQIFPKDKKRETFNINDMLNDILEELTQSMKQKNVKDIKLNKRFDPDVPDISAVKMTFYDALFNIIDNAIDSIESKGEIWIKTYFSKKNSEVLIKVHDNGVGISADKIDRIFNPLYTSKSGGMGMGLWISKNVIDTLGGNIEVSSEVEKDTTFSITLPIGERDA